MPYSPMQLAEAFIQTGELQDALDALNQQLESNPADDDARRLRAQVLMRMPGEGNLRSALADFQNMHTVTADNAISQYEILTRLGDVEGAFGVLERAWGDQPTDRLGEVFVQCLLDRKNGESALIVLATMPKTWRWLNWGGDAAAVIDDYPSALDYYSQSLADLDQRTSGAANAFTANIEASILLKRGDIQRNIGQLIEADADYLAAQAIIPTDPMIPFKRGLLTILRGDQAEAENLCRTAWAEASDALRDEMRRALHEDERYAPLAALLD